ncbi:MAG: sialate O-acetylesterase [Acidobacteria bacterium]|nr:sialate O-acetylesterase [Acidobacteriota bacterium]
MVSTNDVARVVSTLLLAFACGVPGIVQADVQLPHLISDHMVLQQDLPIHIWGKADPREPVTVRFNGQTATAQADDLGRWSTYLKPMSSGGPSALVVEGKNKITIEDVLVGEVWVASGQSNMVLSVSRAANPEQELAAANHPRIRLFQVSPMPSEFALDDVGGRWALCSPESVVKFSAAAYYFARHLHQKLAVPVGVIQSAWGATPAEAWTSRSALTTDPALMPVFAQWSKMLDDYPDARARYEKLLREWTGPSAKPAEPIGPGNQRAPSVLFNGMIAPLTPYAIRGVIWYQGESNGGTKRFVYRKLFPAMIQDWRRAWQLGDFPFLFVQLASYQAPPAAEWAEVRETQANGLQLRNTGMAVTIDIGDPDDVHPKNKQDLGLRLGLAARALAYGGKLVYSGPIFRQFTREDTALRIWFDHTGGGLVAKGGTPKGFVIAGADGEFVPAEARIEDNTVLVSSPRVPAPVAARYAWANYPDCNLYNTEGLPASPFRTDPPRD